MNEFSFFFLVLSLLWFHYVCNIIEVRHGLSITQESGHLVKIDITQSSMKRSGHLVKIDITKSSMKRGLPDLGPQK